MLRVAEDGLIDVADIAAEADAALLAVFVQPYLYCRRCRFLIVNAAAGGNINDMAKIIIEEPELCPRYTARMVKNVKIAPSPAWMRERIRNAGMRPINNIVDITNYVMMEYGQPMHAFDFSCVKDHEIHVRLAREGESIRTLDGTSRALTPSMLCICDTEKPVAVAGVMGGENSEIVGDTAMVLFESANFNGTSIRRTATALGMRTDASSRYEKGLDVYNTYDAVQRACELIELLGAGEVVDGIIDVIPKPLPHTDVKLEPEIPSIVLAGGSTVGLRCPDHPLTLELLRDCGLPLAAPSANPSGEESPKDAGKVLEYFDGKIDAVIDGGRCGLGRESTIIDLSKSPYRILRQGALPAEDIADVLVGGMKIVGITGGTGCGKTTALQELEAMGALVLDCDAIYHELLESSAELLGEIENRFPDTVQDGKLNRKALGAVVFADSAALSDLNAITHKYVGLELQRRLREFAMTGGTLAAIDAIELFSSGINGRCFKTVAVISNKENRIKRIMARDGITREYALLRIAAQHDDGYYAERCDYTLYNNADMDSFRNDCRQLFKEMFSNG